MLFSYSFSLEGFSSLPPYLCGRLRRWHGGKQSSCRRREHKRRGFDPWIRKMPYLLLPGEGSGNPLKYSCLENSMDRGTWWASVHGVAKSRHDQVQHSCTLFQLSLSFITHLNVPVFRHTIPGWLNSYFCLLGHWDREEQLCSFPDATCPEIFLSAHGNHKAMKM